MHDSAQIGDAPRHPNQATSFAGGRYIVESVLGEGGQKVVYLVHDQVLDRQCALSVLKAHELSDAIIERFHREAQIMARLQGTRSVVAVYDFGEEVGAPYLVSEYVAGRDLRREISEHPDGLELERLLEVAEHLLDALAAAHAFGIIHRDLTPGNVWIDVDGRAKLGDFGLALGVGSAASTGAVVGTPFYMAPEQALGEQCDERSDLYSLGVVLYEMGTGRRPFGGEDPIVIVSQHISTAPVAPSWHNPLIPPALESLILALMAKAPGDRPSNAGEVRERLRALRALPAEDRSSPPNPVERLAGGVFVGREPELDELRTIVEQGLAGRRQFVLLGGEPGIGKTRLAEQLATYARLRRADVWWGRCAEGEGAPAFWPWLQILRSAVEAVDEAQLLVDLGEHAERVAQISPEVARRLDITAADAATGADARFALFQAIAAWIGRVAHRRPLVVVLDDLHWADEASILLLHHLTDVLRSDRVVFVGTFRDGEIGREHPLARLVEDIPRTPGMRHIAIPRLPEAAVAAYVEMATGREAPPNLTSAVYRQTDGNALFVTEVVRMMTASGRIDGRDSSWTQEIPAGVRGVIERRLRSLPGDCRNALDAATVIGREFEVRVLERITSLSRDALIAALDEALAMRLITVAPGASRRHGRYTFSHALVRDVLYDGLATGARLRLHAQTASALEILYGDHPGTRISALAHHFREASSFGDVSKAIDYSIQAGDAARRVYAYEDALDHWEAAIELLAEAGRREEEATLLQRAADLTYMSGVHFEHGVLYLERALQIWEHIGDRRREAVTHARLGRTFTTYIDVSDINRALRHFEAALELAPSDTPPNSLLSIYLGLCSARDRALRTSAGLDAARRARAIAESLDRPQLTAMALHQEGVFLDKKGFTSRAISLVDQAWAIADRVNDPIVGFYCSWERGARELRYRGNPRAAANLYLRELAKERTVSSEIQRQQLSIELALAYFACGEIASLQTCELTQEDRELLQDEVEGRWEAASKRYIDDRDKYHRTGNLLVEGMRLESAGIALSNLGRLDDAAELFRAAIDIYAGSDVGAELRSRTLLAAAEGERGHVGLGEEQLRRCDEIMAIGEDWRGQAGRVELARAILSTCRGEFEAASESFSGALKTLRMYELVWDEAEALRLWGRILAASGDASGAIDKFQSAIAIYRRIGAGAPWLARVVREYGTLPSSEGADRTVDSPPNLSEMS